MNDALHELDRLKLALSRLPRTAVTQAGVDRSWPELLFWEGEISRAALKMVRARFAYQRLLADYPGSSWRPHAQLGLGLVFFHQQAYEEARRQFHEVAGLPLSSPLARQARILEGVCQLQLKQFDEALVVFRQDLEQPLDRTPRAQGLFYLGEALTGLGRLEEAVEAYTQAIEADPASRWAHVARFGLGWSEFQRHRCRESLNSFQAYLSDALRQDTQDALQAVSETPLELLFAQGRCSMELGDEAKALALFEALQARDPEHTLAIDAALSQAELLQRQGRLNDARSVVDTILRRAFEPGQIAQANLRLAALDLAQGEAARAIERFQLAQDADDLTIRQAAWNGLADAHLMLGDSAEAAREYDASLQAASASTPGLYAAYQLGRLMLQVGHVSEAVASFEHVAQGQDPVLAADARFALVLAYLSTAQPARARLELEQMLSQDPTGPQAARADYYLALFALQDGKAAEAKALCQDVIQGAPASDEAFEAHLLLVDLTAADASAKGALAVLSQWVDSLQRPPSLGDGASASHVTGTADWQRSLPPRSVSSPAAADTSSVSSPAAADTSSVSSPAAADTSSPERIAPARSAAWTVPPRSVATPPGRDTSSAAWMVPPRSRGKLEKKFGDLFRKSLAYAQAIHWYEAAWPDLPIQQGELEYRMASCYEEAGDTIVAMQRYQAIAQPPWQIRGQLAAAKLMERAERRQDAMKIYEDIARQSAPEAKIAEERLILLGKTRP
ncbi:MAG: tetratricopeptide repeat protein [Candidatus Omnitrophica bacterium]|nr:tetratricopeptide repeat protein [Candidatus Omnitrophota bacterium]